MGEPKRRRGRARNVRIPKRVRFARKAAKRKRQGEAKMKRALGIHPTDVLPHIIGRREWRGMRDYAPEENGPVRVRKVVR